LPKSDWERLLILSHHLQFIYNILSIIIFVVIIEQISHFVMYVVFIIIINIDIISRIIISGSIMFLSMSIVMN